MKVKYNRVSTIAQTGNRFEVVDKDNYDQTFFDKISGSVPFKERPQAKRLIKLIEDGKVNELVVEEFSRLGRNTADVINNLQWLDDMNVNVNIRNISLQSRPNNTKNPIFKLLSNILSSVYEMELQNIKERTLAGRAAYVNKGGILGRPTGATETIKEFLDKDSSKKVVRELERCTTIRDIAKIAGVSTKTVMKVKSLTKPKTQIM